MAKLPYFHAGRRLDDSATNRDLNRYAALETASCGWPVFPCAAKETPFRKAKSPLTMWKDTASAIAGQVGMAWRHFPDAIHGIHLELTPFVVIDLDAKEGAKNGLHSWERIKKGKTLSRIVPAVTTPSLGQHLYFRQPPGIKLGNREGKLTGQGINVRGAGGYVIGPGSVMADGKRYVFEGDTKRLADAEEIPGWLVEMILDEPKKGPSETWHAQPVSEARMDAYYAAAFEKELDDLRGAPVGERNRQLNDTAFNIFQMVNKGLLERGVAEAAIAQAATQCGLHEREISTTMNSAYKGAARSYAGARKKGPDMRDDGITDNVNYEKLLKGKKSHEAINKKAGKFYWLKDLEHKIFSPPKFIAEGLISEGVTLLAGKPKMGKSFLVLDLAYAVATGTEFMGRKCEQGDVLYLALEDNDRRIKDRFEKLASKFTYDAPLALSHEWPIGQDAILEMRAWANDRPNARLVIADTLKKVKAKPKGRNGESYSEDYEALDLMHRFYLETGISILPVTHTRKSEAEDVFDTVTGTLGVNAAVDATVVMQRLRDGSIGLHGRGRDMEQYEHAIKFNKDLMRWELIGGMDEVVASGMQKKILNFMKEQLGGVTPNQVAEATGFNAGSIRKQLLRMVDKCLIEICGRGQYVAVFE